MLKMNIGQVRQSQLAKKVISILKGQSSVLREEHPDYIENFWMVESELLLYEAIYNTENDQQLLI